MLKVICTAITIVLVAFITLQAVAAAPFKTRATLSSVDTPLKGKAMFQQKNNHQGPYRLDVHVNRALPLQTLDVTIDGVFIGQIFTSADGTGRLRLKNLADPIPAGAIIAVGASSGVFATPGHE